MKIKSIIGIVSMALFMPSCIKYHCDGYPEKERFNLAFRLNDTIKYCSNKNDTINLIVNNFYAEGPSSFRGLAMDVWCDKEAYYTTTKDPIFGISIKEVDISDPGSDSPVVYFCEKDTYDFKYEYLKDKDYEVNKRDTITINGILYNSATEVTDKSGLRRITNYVKVGNHGIVKFYDSEKQLTWTQIINTKEN